MPTETNCPHCSQTLTVPDAPQGRLAKCAHCGGIFPLAVALANGNAQGARPATLESTAPGSREAEAGGDSPSPASSPTEHRAEARADERSAASEHYASSASDSPAEAARVVSHPSASAVSGSSQDPSPAGWHLRIPEGRTYGPVDRAKLERWLQEGRIDAECSLRHGDQGPWIPAATLFPQVGVAPNDQPDVRRPAYLPQTAYAPRPPAPGVVNSHAGAAATPHYAPGVYNASAYGAGQPVRRTATSDSYAASPYGPAANATGSPFRGTQALPHRGEVVFLLGLFGMLLGCPVFSGAAWYLGGSDLRAMNLGIMNPTGRGLTTFGYVLGIVVSCFWIVAVLVAMLIISISILTQ